MMTSDLVTIDQLKWTKASGHIGCVSGGKYQERYSLFPVLRELKTIRPYYLLKGLVISLQGSL